MERWREPLTKVLGTRTAAGLETMGLHTVGDLLRHYPRRYAEPGQFTPLSELREGEHVSVIAEVVSSTSRTMRNRGGAILEAIVTDGVSHLSLTFFAKRTGILRMHEDKLRPGRTGLFTGTVGDYRGKRQLAHPDYIIVGLDAENEEDAIAEASRPIPLYPASAKVPTWRIARAVRTVLDPLSAEDVPDPIPSELLEERGYLPIIEALRAIHNPADTQQAYRAQARFKYEEALVLQTALARKRARAAALTSVARPGKPDGLVTALDARLPFALTSGQREVGEQLSRDLATPVPMQRLLQGDVGSGKTVVALRAMLQVVDSGGQAALLAPTEVLAAQHLETLRSLLGELAQGGMLTGAADATRIALLTGSQGSKERRAALAEAASGSAGIVVGTHALLSETVQFADLGLVVVDEQHRFGVEQRDALRNRGERPPHMLVMTATPIPRTIAMTVFGDLETSVLAEKPAGRAEVVTHIVPADNDAWMARSWARMREEINLGRRAYVVCARIDPGEPAATGKHTTAASVQPDDGALFELPPEPDAPPLTSVAEVAATLRTRPELAGLSIGVMHGRLSADDKANAMAGFARGDTQVLVSTTVIEVGVDVQEASVMMIMDADRFGLSQLHQLRGRIGRGGLPGLCLLVSRAEEGTDAWVRLSALVATTDGFSLAETDIELRREGDVLGAAQSGGRNSLRLLRVLRDATTIEAAQRDARGIIADDPTLAHHVSLGDAIGEWLEPVREEFIDRT